MSQTHDLSTRDGVLTKRYTSWRRGEHRREWAALHRIHAHAPDLVPRPLTADLDADPPVITMSLLPGSPLGNGPLTSAQLDALETALRALWSVPAADLAPRRPASDADVAYGRELLTSVPRPTGGTPALAYDAALAWWDGPDLDRFRAPHPEPVIGHGDPNLPNYLWDGARIRIVDFEDAGRSDVALELGALAEHLSARDTDWEGFCGRFDVDAGRLLAARRLWAAFWLHMLVPGGRSAHRNPPEVCEAQAARVLDLLG
ncbi:aminoglycoside phosphotransferase family protein [Longispora sp. K20-0274]|uniref:phosphotransferase family protein n=1 Tax=Longispora sp. K20-0274 TaxID=3088255 RepID=UPI003999F1E5